MSVLIISYNQVDFIHETLQSALEQDYDNFEVVVADDGSTDGTVEVINQLALEYPKHLIPLVGGPNLGITGNSNRGLKACKGELIAFQGGDDVLVQGKISRQVAWFRESPDRILCGHDVELIDSVGRHLGYWSDHTTMRQGYGTHSIIERGVPYCATAIMLKASRIPPHRFDQRIPIASDWLFWIEVMALGGWYGHIEGAYAKYRRHGRNITNAVPQQRLDDVFATLGLVESRYPHLIGSCVKGRAHQFYARGVSNLLAGYPSTARGFFLHALRQRWLSSWKVYGWLFLSWFPLALAHYVRIRRQRKQYDIPRSNEVQ